MIASNEASQSYKSIGNTDEEALKAAASLEPTETACDDPIQKELDALAESIKEKLNDQGRNYYEIGQNLNDAKNRIDIGGYGKWAIWLKQTGIAERTAQTYMKVARTFPNAQSVADLGIAKAQLLASLPDEKRESVMSRNHIVRGMPKTVAEMSVNALRDVVRRENAPPQDDPPPTSEDATQPESDRQNETDEGTIILRNEFAHHLSAAEENARFLKNFLRGQAMDSDIVAEHRDALKAVLQAFQDCIDAAKPE